MEIAFWGEFIGTMLLILLGNGVVANVVLNSTKGNNGGWIVITLGWGLGVFVGVLVAGPYSGAHLNPAVTFGLALAGKFDWFFVPVYIIAQLLGAMLGAMLVFLFYKDHYKVSSDQGAMLATFCTGPAIRHKARNFFCEMIGTFVLLISVFYIQGPDANIADTEVLSIGLGSVGAIPIAFVVVAIGLSLGGTTGYAINPARDLGPRFMHAILPIPGKGGSDWSYSFVPILGPLAGAVLAVLVAVSTLGL
ncbi:MIP/aquaporin family protein [Aureibacter tunicatorum]|uniref:Glycerol uptake facilitator protein n=1 Tax=Aureibacter tunicatorum TaxID=866807 RepID=A0AAE3XSJ9_9BACT|nr:MIP/aquaporin family protein [Aureibacter tunicatorum]MDR6241215.1 glycerol uptake facilitator protein [Aureibacter tunicatorum]BDD03476.1 glycerol uptake facilitator protein [Aureibacter tunicatorum]